MFITLEDNPVLQFVSMFVVKHVLQQTTDNRPKWKQQKLAPCRPN